MQCLLPELPQYAGRRYPHVNIVVVSGTTVKPMPGNTMFFPTEPRNSPPLTKNLDKSGSHLLKTERLSDLESNLTDQAPQPDPMQSGLAP